jgi:predicted nucleic acid-binding protein
MITAVDTNVLVDVFRDDARHCRRSADALRRCIREGQLVVCDVVWAELAALFPSSAELAERMGQLNVGFSPMSNEAASLAGEMWKRYRTRETGRGRVIADFLIGAHAMTQTERLLTRDRGFYRDYFADLVVVDPSAAE